MLLMKSRWPVSALLLLMAALLCAGNNGAGTGPTLYDYVSVDTIALVNVPDFNLRTAAISVTSDAVYLFPSKKYSKGDSIVVFSMEHRTRKLDTIVLRLKKDMKIDAEDEVTDFAISDRHAVVMTWDMALLFKRDSCNEEFSPVHAIKTRNSYESVRMLGDRCFVSSCRYQGDTMQRSNTHAGMLDLERGIFIWERSLPDPHGSVFMFFRPRSVLDCSGKEILVSDIDRYEINLFDLNYGHIATLRRDSKRWVGATDTGYMKLVPAVSTQYHPKKLIEELTPFMETKSFIKRADFVNDSTLLVSWLPGRTVDLVSAKIGIEITLYDIWRKSGNEWKLIAADLESPIPPLTEIFSETGRWPLAYDYFCNESYLVGLEPIPVSLYSGKTLADIGKEINEYYLEHEFSYSMLLYRFIQ